MTKAFGPSDERYRVFDELSAAQRALVKKAFASLDDAPFYTLVELGLPPLASLRRWAGLAPPTLLERAAGRWPVWKWLKAATLDEVAADDAITAVTKALGAGEIRELCLQLSSPSWADDAYDLFGKEHNGLRGELHGNPFAANVIRMLGSLVDASGKDAAIVFADRVEKQIADDNAYWIGAIATFALAARARRRGEPFPPARYALAQQADFLPGRKLREAMRDIIELIAPADRDAFLVEFAPTFATSSAMSIENGKERSVPILLHGWLYADLCPNQRVAKGMVADLARWDRDPKPTPEALAMIAKVGAICAPHLKAIKAKAKPTVIAKALALFAPARRR